MKELNVQDAYNSETYNQAVLSNNPETRQRISSLFSKDEIQALRKRSDLYGWYAILLSWGGVALCFVLMAWASHLSLYYSIPIFIVATALLAGRQLSMSLAIHEASHGTLFKTKWLNNDLADWLCARPMWNELEQYRPYHFKHHTQTGSPEDPDLVLSAGYPTSRLSLARKFARDLSGFIGIQYLVGRLLMDLEIIDWTFTGVIKWKKRNGRSLLSYPAALLKNSYKMLITNIVLYSILKVFGYGGLYVFWIIAYISFFMLFMRIRSMAEHANLEAVPNLFRNTRTSKSNLLTRLTVAPLNVNYHQEHHVITSCSYFNLPKVHKLLREKGMVPEPPSYWDVLRQLSSASHAPKNQHIKRFNK